MVEAMEYRVLLKKDIRVWVEWLMGKGELHALVAKSASHPQYQFEKISQPDTVCLDYATTILPPKQCVQPVRETLIRFDRVANQFTLSDQVPERRLHIIFGIHTCDIHAFNFLNTVMRDGNADTQFLARSANTAIIGLRCRQHCDDKSFCESMGTNEPPDTGYDILMTDIGDRYFLELATERAAKLVDDLSCIPHTGDEDVVKWRQMLADSKKNFDRRLSINIEELPAYCEANYHSPMWDVIGKKCVACGSCTLVCPTCYCFDIRDELDMSLQGGERYRVWDSCQLGEFAAVAGGVNFRRDRRDRQRHRVHRKVKYPKERYNLFACVGCGRCSRACIADIQMLDILRQLGAKSHEFQRT